MRRALSAVAMSLALAAPRAASGAGLDINTEYRLRALSYTNLGLNTDAPNNHSFLSESARLGITLKNIHLRDVDGETESMDVVLKLRALGVARSSAPAAAPFNRIAARYANTDFVPFFENAYLALHALGGTGWDLSIGRQSFMLGSGLLLSDNGAGLTGVSARHGLPWGMNFEGFAFQDKAPLRPGSSGGSVDLFGLTLEVPSEGKWQFHQLVEKDRSFQTLLADNPAGSICAADPLDPLKPNGCAVSQATRWFSSLRYQLRFGPMIFDGEAAFQRGAATPTGVYAAPNHVTFQGNAQVIRAKWKQDFFTSKTTGKTFRGIARASLARGSGDNPSTQTTDEAFFPSHGHRFDGLEREGFGEFFAATPYDAFGGQSTATVNGLHRGRSGIVIVGLGITPPAWRGIVLDLDYYLFQADRNMVDEHRTLGSEFDIRLRYDVKELLTLRFSGAFFSTGPGSNPAKNSARRYLLEASGRF